MMTVGNVASDLEMVHQRGHRFNINTPRMLALLLLVAMLLVPCNPLASAQDAEPAAEAPAKPKGYTVIPGSARGSMISMAQKGQVDDQAAFDNYYTALLGQFTQPGQFANAFDLRKIIRRDARTGYSRASKQFHGALNTLLLAKLQPLVVDEQYHPAARFNWMLILGDLNEVESVPGANNPEVPLAATLPVLIPIAGDAKQADSVRLAALIGLDRHANATGIDGAEKDSLVPILKEVVSQQTPPKGRDPEVHKWFQDRATAILTTLGVEMAVPAAAPEAADSPDGPADGPDAPADGPEDGPSDAP